jgi:hypothetical protein
MPALIVFHAYCRRQIRGLPLQEVRDDRQ